MCGRLSNHLPIPDLVDYFQLTKWLDFENRYNIAPSQKIPAIRQNEDQRELFLLHWGLVPHWAKDVKIGYRMINARAETLTEKPSFREPFHKRRCIIPASGFYEWQQGAKTRQPYYLFRQDHAPLALAGLWERWENPATPGVVLESCTIITTAANALMAALHQRMPAILEPEEFGAWLDPRQQGADLLPLLRPAAAGVLACFPVSTYVNKPGNEGADCVRPLDSPEA
ncbi:SOS response-associated peptidase [Desulfuromonas carbonis]|uniref:SOS response-associated peptidase n=1 Tax=Desulfuromonas sp. DDH964 TaxID=1823759 RepID=UPI00078C231B|nr:SOS response-associated peptidase [Desulfuromonas sp. DDH964]AMV71270.1 hypothetical protein DBW_0888 [Desulfuromonas sp. DDH964]